jgi:hypothetical protein
MEDYPILPDDRTVKNWEEKLNNIGRPTIFIGSSLESREIADRVKTLFPLDEFEVDIWYDGIFGKTRSTGGKMSNIEWLKNFTDIYDFAIFIFVPEDEIISNTRFDYNDGINKNSARKALVTRHNVVFEFGMFLGRIGAKRSFILFEDNDDTQAFIKLFFSDLKENLDDQKLEINNNFRIELYPYSGSYKKAVKSKFKTSALVNSNIEEAVEKIKKQIKINFEDIDIGFLPSTSLAIGYFNNLVKIAVTNINDIKCESTPKAIADKAEKDAQILNIINLLKSKTNIQIKIIIPDSLEGAKHKAFEELFAKANLKKITIPGYNIRDVGVFVTPESLQFENPDFVIYDIPTTMSSSIEAIEMLNPYKDIRELLHEKERRNFLKSTIYKMNNARGKELADIDKWVKIIEMQEFKSIFALNAL